MNPLTDMEKIVNLSEKFGNITDEGIRRQLFDLTLENEKLKRDKATLMEMLDLILKSDDWRNDAEATLADLREQQERK